MAVIFRYSWEITVNNSEYSRRSLIRSHLDAQILDTVNFLWLIELTVIYSKYVKSILKLRIKKFARVTDW
jgi:hypothetical protein